MSMGMTMIMSTRMGIMGTITMIMGMIIIMRTTRMSMGMNITGMIT